MVYPPSSSRSCHQYSVECSNPFGVLGAVTESLHNELTKYNIQKLAQQGLIAPFDFNGPHPSPLQNYELDLIHIYNFDFAALSYNCISILMITTLAFGILGMLGFTSTVLLSLSFLSLAAIALNSMETSEKQRNFNNPGGMEVTPPTNINECYEIPVIADFFATNPAAFEICAADPSQIPSMLAANALLPTSSIPLYAKRLGLISHNLPQNTQLTERDVEWKPTFFALDIMGAEIPLLVNTTVRLDLLCKMTLKPEKYYKSPDAGINNANQPQGLEEEEEKLQQVEPFEEKELELSVGATNNNIDKATETVNPEDQTH